MSTVSYLKHKVIWISTDYSKISMVVCTKEMATFVTSEKKMKCVEVRVRKRLNFPFIDFYTFWFCTNKALSFKK